MTSSLDEDSYPQYQTDYLGCRYFIITKEGFPAFVVYCVKDLRSLLTLTRQFLAAWVLLHIPTHCTNYEMISEYGMEHAKEAIKTMITTRFIKYHFFISYRNGFHRNDAKMIFQEIEYLHYNVFLDMKKLNNGVLIDSEIIGNLIRSQVFVPLISISTLQSIMNNIVETPNEVDYVLLEWVMAIGLMECNHRDFPIGGGAGGRGGVGSSKSKGLLCYPIMKIWPIVFIEEGDFMSDYRIFKANRGQSLRMIPSITFQRAQTHWQNFVFSTYNNLDFPWETELTIGEIFDKLIGNYRFTSINRVVSDDFGSIVRYELPIVLRR